MSPWAESARCYVPYVQRRSRNPHVPGTNDTIDGTARITSVRGDINCPTKQTMQLLHQHTETKQEQLKYNFNKYAVKGLELTVKAFCAIITRERKLIARWRNFIYTEQQILFRQFSNDKRKVKETWHFCIALTAPFLVCVMAKKKKK